MKIHNSLQNKFLILFILVAIIPFAVNILYVSSVTLNEVEKNIEQSSATQLKNIDTIVYERTKNIQLSMNNIYLNNDIKKILMEDNKDYELFDSQIKQCIMGSNDIYGLIFTTTSGNAYTYNVNAGEAEILRIQIIYNNISEIPNTFTWFGQIPSDINPTQETMIMATTAFNIHDENNGYKKIANIYIYVKNDIFSEAIGGNNDGTFIVVDQTGKIVSNSGEQRYTDILNNDVNLMRRMFSESTGVLKLNYKNEKNTSVIHYNSPITSFKYVKICDTDMLYKRANEIKIYIIMMVVILFVIAMMIYSVIVKRITKPILLVSEHMNNMSWDNISDKIEFYGTDEVGCIVTGYNKMSDKIYEMVEEIKIKEKKKTEADILSMNYRINSHFLHNTLAMLRILAIKNNDSDVSMAIFDLNRILKNIFRSSGYISIQKEVDLIQSFIRILNLRYMKKIEFSINVDENANEFAIPCVLIQPLIENAVLHGVSPKMSNPDFSPKVDISIGMENEKIKIEIIDNGVGMEEKTAKERIKKQIDDSQGMGMANVDERIKIIYGEEYGISVTSKIGQFTKIILLLPAIK